MPKSKKVPEYFCILVGNPIDGFDVLGPFENGCAAADYGHKYFSDEDWWVVKMGKVEKDA